MKDKILAALKTKFANLGFGDKAFTGVAEYLAATVTEESQIETVIAGVEPLLKSFQGDIDSRVNSALAKQKAELEKKPAEQKPAEQKPADEEPQWAKDLKARLEAREIKESQAELSAKLRVKLKEKGVPESFLKNQSLTVEKEEEIETMAAAIETNFNETKQELINQGLVGEAPKKPSAAEEKAEIDNYLKEKFPEKK